MDDQLKILISEADIAEKIEEMASQISADYAGRELILVCILKGASVFSADPSRRITIPVTVEFIQASSYGASTVSSRRVVIRRNFGTDVEGKHVLLVDGIIDTGETLAFLLEHFSGRKPASIKIAVLLDKRTRRTADVPLAYLGFEIPDVFVVGYGMDCGDRYRNLPYIGILQSTH